MKKDYDLDRYGLGYGHYETVRKSYKVAYLWSIIAVLSITIIVLAVRIHHLTIFMR